MAALRVRFRTEPRPLADSPARQRRRAVDMERQAAHIAPRRPDGGVVTQRTANPCTPVRFRLGPPAYILARRGRGRTPVRPLPRFRPGLEIGQALGFGHSPMA